jgi:hypothetical protein
MTFETWNNLSWDEKVCLGIDGLEYHHANVSSSSILDVKFKIHDQQLQQSIFSCLSCSIMEQEGY